MAWIVAVLFILSMGVREVHAQEFSVEVRPASFSETHGGFVLELEASQAGFFAVRALLPERSVAATRDLPRWHFDLRVYAPAGAPFRPIGSGSQGMADYSAAAASLWEGWWVAMYIGRAGRTEFELQFPYTVLRVWMERGISEMRIVVEGQFRTTNRVSMVIRGVTLEAIPPPPVLDEF